MILTLSCQDRPGIVARISGALFRNNANILDAQQYDDLDTGRFFMRVVVDPAKVDEAALRADLPPAAGWVEAAALVHLPALLLARVAGKSPAEYLLEEHRAQAWQRGIDLIRHPAGSVEEAFTR